MELIKLKEKPRNWDDLINNFDTKTLFHEYCWHQHIAHIHKRSKMEYFQILADKEIIGYFCGLTVKKGPLKIMGSPLKGTGTNYMGPIVSKNIDQSELLNAIQKMCKKENICHIELNNDLLKKDQMAQNRFEKHFSVTHKVSISKNENVAYKNLKSTCRNRIKKAIKNGLNVEKADYETIVENFYSQFKEVYGKQGQVVPFGKERLETLYKYLFKADRLLPLIVKMGENIVATGLFPFDKNAIYFWGATSWLKYHKYCPNEILHWAVIQFAVEKGIPVYNMCGGKNQFKNKFGGSDVEHITYSKSYLPFLKQARKLYEESHFWKLKILGKLKGYDKSRIKAQQIE